MLKILLTRTKENNAQLATKIAAVIPGAQFFHLPLLEHSILEEDFGLLREYHQVVVTSLFAAGLVPVRKREIQNQVQDDTKGGVKDSPHTVIPAPPDPESNYDTVSTQSFLVVGKNTAQTIEGKGWSVAKIFENVSDLKLFLINQVRTKTLYLSGSKITEAMPVFVDRVIIYTTNYKQELSKEEVNIFSRGIDIIPVASMNCAKTLIELINKAELSNLLVNSYFVAISSRVGELLQKQFKNVIIANSPDQLTETIIEYAKKIRRAAEKTGK